MTVHQLYLALSQSINPSNTGPVQQAKAVQIYLINSHSDNTGAKLGSRFRNLDMPIEE